VRVGVGRERREGSERKEGKERKEGRVTQEASEAGKEVKWVVGVSPQQHTCASTHPSTRLQSKRRERVSLGPSFISFISFFLFFKIR